MQQPSASQSACLSIEAAYRELRFPAPPAHRPYVILNFVVTVDGQASLGATGAAHIGSATDHRLLRVLRAHADGLLHGAGTVRADNFPPRVPDDLVPERLSRGLQPQPLAVVITRSGNIEPDNRYFSGRTPVIVTTADARPRVAERFGTRALVISAGEDTVDLAEGLEMLRSDHGIRLLVCEGGPTLARALLEGRNLDEVFLTIAPKLGSDRHARRLLEGAPFPAHALPRLELLHVLSHESELFLRYRVV
jgi:riboflavin-specific deaminase-like protein